MTYEVNDKHGKRVLAKGRGQYDLMDVCYKHHWTDENSVLVVDDVDDMDSTWTIYEPLKEE